MANLSDEEKADAALSIAQDAMQTTTALEERVEELESERERLVYRVAELEVQVDTEEKDYEQLTFEQKVGRVSEHLLKKANAAPNGKASIDYDDVVWSVFDGQPSASHAYKLMRHAGENDGYQYRDGSNGGNKRLAANVEAAKDAAAFSHAKKDVRGGGE